MSEMTLEELRESLDVGCLPNTDRPRWFAAIDAAIKQREQDKLDAARYRWLRKQHNSSIPSWHVRSSMNSIPLDLDIGLDAEMERESGNG